MCIVAIAQLASDPYALIVAANRDERHARPSAAAHWWNGPGSVLAGKDLAAGGTWLGVTGSGRFAAVTNIFEAGALPAERSRGALVASFLHGTESPAEFAAALATEGSRYGPFNLVLRQGEALEFVSNRHAPARLDAGIHVFSNNAPGLVWPKVDALARAMERAAGSDNPHAFLIETLSGPDARGPIERASDSLFVVGDSFGTRCTTVLTIDRAGRARFVEQRFAAGGASSDRSEWLFELSGLS